MRHFLLLLPALILGWIAPTQAGVPNVVATLQPLHSLAAMVMQGVGQPDLLIRGAVSEHGFALKPSDARKLAAADLVLLVDPEYERFAAKSLRDKPTGALLAWATLPGVLRLPPRNGGIWAGDEHHDHGHDHAHAGDMTLDGHLWLDVDNARLFVQSVAHRLGQMDPEHAPRYADNARQAEQRLELLDQKIRQTLQPVADRPFVVFHDAYHYFERRYGLKGVGSVTVDPDRPPSAKRLARLRDALQGRQAACVFAEPQFPSPLVQTIARSAGIGQGTLDPQGASLNPGPDLYSDLLTQLADNIHSCLGQARP